MKDNSSPYTDYARFAASVTYDRVRALGGSPTVVRLRATYLSRKFCAPKENVYKYEQSDFFD